MFITIWDLVASGDLDYTVEPLYVFFQLFFLRFKSPQLQEINRNILKSNLAMPLNVPHNKTMFSSFTFNNNCNDCEISFFPPTTQCFVSLQQY